jgi:polar amino acid transport system permease protein
MNDDIAFWLSYLTNGKHLAWYASFQFTIFAALMGGDPKELPLPSPAPHRHDLFLDRARRA